MFHMHLPVGVKVGLKETEVRLEANATLHQQWLEQSQHAEASPTASRTARTNLVVVTGQPLW